MKTPAWAVVIGIMLMLFGACGAMKHSYAVITPQMMEMQEKIMDRTMETIEDNDSDYDDTYDEIDSLDFYDEVIEDENEFDDSGDVDQTDTLLIESESIPPPQAEKQSKEALKQMRETMDMIYKLSPFQKKWMVIFGYIGAAVCLIYFFSGVFLVTRKIFSIRFVYFALALSIVFTLTQIFVLSSDTGSGMMGKMSSYGGIFGLVLDIILLIVFAILNKSDLFTTQKEVPKEGWENF